MIFQILKKKKFDISNEKKYEISRLPVPVNLTRLVRTMHNICKVQGTNIGHHKKKIDITPFVKNMNIEIMFLAIIF